MAIVNKKSGRAIVSVYYFINERVTTILSVDGTPLKWVQAAGFAAGFRLFSYTMGVRTGNLNIILRNPEILLAAVDINDFLQHQLPSQWEATPLQSESPSISITPKSPLNH